MNGMDRSLKRADDEEQMAYEMFFVDGKVPERDKMGVMDLIKNQMSKDLNMKKWGEMSFKKVKVDEWWSEPNQVEKDRFMKMPGGGSLRKAFTWDVPKTKSS
ncbi:unnamed protein product [Fusarium venenatum]|uniref:Uncharacterized protein n=1 Tax=Fusarium venenatum TaxID=56646 RepID=A0A2L2TML2_9HYPO|nr:uncharacterized protein FVRRES_06166 [Fusarium venenatum]KAH6993188.1 hypothetical protein EDB82DRAFT_524272 [Fusarium venenatum]CEI61730.1 unnamed protein product [Fusarium venenatum]